jgi:mannose-6-phosphate isomerase-like protein (cupin superfamily)
MRMILFVSLFVTLSLGAASAQQPAAQSPALFASAADIAALIAKAKSGMKPGQPAAGEWILKLDPSATAPSATFPVGHIHLDYLVGMIPNAALVHERRAELFYVLEGSGTVIIGGTLHDETRANPETRRGSGVDGGKPQRLAKGDMLLIPDNTPHFFSQVDSNLVFISLMLPVKGDK